METALPRMYVLVMRDGLVLLVNQRSVSILPVVSMASALLQKHAAATETGVVIIARVVPMDGRQATAAPLYARLGVITVRVLFPEVVTACPTGQA